MNPFIGQIIMFAGNFDPRSWALCNGQLLPINQYDALFSILGTTYGGDGRTTFALPDMRGRVPMHAGQGQGLSRRNLGSKGGAETTVLNETNLPAHKHAGAIKVSTVASDEDAPSASASIGSGKEIFVEATPNQDLAIGSLDIGRSGQGQEINNIQPYETVNFIIALQGVYPSRS